MSTFAVNILDSIFKMHAAQFFLIALSVLNTYILFEK